MDTTIQTERDKGFTLIELLIVIVILGILATITVFAVNGITSNARDNACDADFRTLEVAIEAYAAENDLATSENIVAGTTGAITAPADAVGDSLADYTRTWPTDWTVAAGVPVPPAACT